ncbi:MAG: hypothetical protein AAF490_28020, partial [Chloroflexota bacterium]
KHIAQNPDVSVTIPIAKRIPFLPWIKIPAATITFPGIATVLDNQNAPAEIVNKLHEGTQLSKEAKAASVIIQIKPTKSFVTYGIGVSLQKMRDTEKARGRAAVG